MKYRLVINDEPNGKPLLFSYGNTKRIELKVSSMGATATCELKRDYRSQLPDCYLGNLIKEAMKRASLVYLLRYQKSLVIRSLRLEVKSSANSIEEAIDLQNDFTLYSMITGRLKRPISSAWKQKDVLQRILTYQKSKDYMSCGVAALYAYLYSKSKQFETERFFFLWMAMNGMYVSLAPAGIVREDRRIREFLVRFGLGEEMINSHESERLCKLVMLQLLNYQEPITRESLLEENHGLLFNLLQQSILVRPDGTAYRVTPFGFMLVVLPYYLRCKLFHANKPAELFSFKNDMELNALRVVNSLIEEFLDHELLTVFSIE